MLNNYPNFVVGQNSYRNEISFLWPKCAFGFKLKSQFILLFNLFLLLFINPTALVGIIYGTYYTISANFYLYLQYFQQKNFTFNKISESQTDQNYQNS